MLNARRHNPAPAWVRQRQTEDAYLERMHGFAVDYADVDATGRGEMGELAPETTLVAMGAANADIGTVQDVAVSLGLAPWMIPNNDDLR